MHRFFVSWRVKYQFILKKYCRKIITKRVSPMMCRHVRLVARSRRCFKLYGNHKYGNERYLKLTIAYAVMRNCRCYLRYKHIMEPCRCYKQKRWVIVRHCPGRCRHVCPKSCYWMRVWMVYKLRKFYRNGRKIILCIPKPLFRQKFRCCEYIH